MLPASKIRPMRSVIKIPITNIGYNEITVPFGSKFLNISKQRSYTNSNYFELLLWIETNSISIRPSNEIWTIYIVMTNEKFSIDENYKYINTIVLRNDPLFIVHVYLNNKVL